MTLAPDDRERVKRYAETHPNAEVVEVLAQVGVHPKHEGAVEAILHGDDPTDEPETDGSAPETDTPEQESGQEPTDESEPSTSSDGTTAETDRGEDDILTAADLLVGDDGHAELPDQSEVRNAVAAATDYYHDQIETNHRDLIQLKWGISNATIDELMIGFAPSGNGLVDHLFGEGFMPLIQIRAGLVSAPVVKHAYGIGDCPNDCHHDVPDAFHIVGRMRARGEIEYEDIDLAAVVAYAGREDCLDLYAWWDNRIVFPYWTNNSSRYLIGRATGQTDDIVYGNGEAAKYVKQSSDKPWVDTSAVSEPIYGTDTVEQDEPLIITEGMTDAIMAHQYGFPCISPVTKQFKSEHHRPLLLQAQRASKVYLCLDNEESGEGLKGALKTGMFLDENGIDARVATLPRPDDVDKVDLAAYLNEHSADDLSNVLSNAVAPEEHPAYDDEDHNPASDRDEYTGTTVSGSGDGSALFDLDIRDVTGMDHLDRGKNPIKHRGDSENYFVIIQEGGDYLAYDHKAEAGYYGLTYLLCKAGRRNVDDPTGRLDDSDIFAAWRQAKRDGNIPQDDPAPYRALIHVVREHDLLPRDMVPDPDDYGDDNRLSASVYNRALGVIEDEYGVSSGRSEASGGKHLPSEEDLGLDEKPKDEQDELAQFVKKAKLNARKAGNS